MELLLTLVMKNHFVCEKKERRKMKNEKWLCVLLTNWIWNNEWKNYSVEEFHHGSWHCGGTTRTKLSGKIKKKFDQGNFWIIIQVGKIIQWDKYSKTLNACNPIRLGLALNFSVFHYEVMNNHKKACELGEAALTEALEKIDDVDEETFRDAKSIIELLKENLILFAVSNL